MPLDSAFVGQINRAFGVIGLVVGLAFIIGGGFFIHHNHLDEFMLKPAVAEAEVVENKSKENYPGTGSRTLPYTSYQAIVRFTDQQGQTVTYADKFGFSRPSFMVGQKVRIFYDPQNPQHAMIDRGPKKVCCFWGTHDSGKSAAPVEAHLKQTAFYLPNASLFTT